MTVLYLLVILAFGLYSFSQIDLNLTLLQSPWFLSFQQTMIGLGYFNRPLSTGIFLALLLMLGLFNLYFVKTAHQLGKGQLIILLSGLTVFGLFSYPAFSHDIFNYLFDARIVVEHGQNPYFSTALMFPSDTWTRFMNWTHRTYPYGPVFLPLSVVFYLFGFGKFISTLLSFKAMATIAYLGCIYLIYRLKGKGAALFFALNPLIIIEAVNSSHLDIVMLFGSLLGVYLLSLHRKTGAWTSLALSTGVKYSSIVLTPVFVWWHKISGERRYLYLAELALLGAGFQIIAREILPHYFIVPIGFAALVSDKKFVIGGAAVLSFALLAIRYYPFLITGQWTQLTIAL